MEEKDILLELVECQSRITELWLEIREETDISVIKFKVEQMVCTIDRINDLNDSIRENILIALTKKYGA